MAETSVLAELMFEIVPMWCEKLDKYIKEAEDVKKPSSRIIITPSGVDVQEDNTPLKITTPGIDGAVASGESPAYPDKGTTIENSILHLKKLPPAPHGICRIEAKPDSSKTRFSSITGPVIMYDGESQRMLSELWTSLNIKRGGLRREMMTLKRRQELASPRMMPKIEVESETEADGNSSTGKDEEDDLEHSSEVLRLRLKMEREKMKLMNRRAGGVGVPVARTTLGPLPFKRARTMQIAGPLVSTAQAVASAPSCIDEQRLRILLEGIDDNLDKACKVTETVAFVWLKGDGYAGYLKLIVGQLKDTAARIKASDFMPAKPKETASSAPVASSHAKPMPPPPTPLLCPELSRKKSDRTMRDACAVSLMAATPVKAEWAEHTRTTTSIPIDVESIKDEVTPAMLANMVATGKAPEESHRLSQSITNSLDPEVIEVEDADDEGIVC